MSMKALEVNFDGLVGPCHNYAGLAYGNIASMGHGLTASNPRAALLQGLRKMKLLADLGLKQAVLPPHERPDFDALRRLGFRGADAEVLSKVAKEAPRLLAACYSSSAMWAANAATVSPSADAADGRVHFTPANLVSQFHRSVESTFTGIILKAIFSDDAAFAHHAPLPAAVHFSDEGAANHTRLCTDYAKKGIELFVYGRKAFGQFQRCPFIFPARQALEASEAVARLNQLDPSSTVFAQQNPAAIDAGVFHNDVISVGNEGVFVYHADAFRDSDAVIGLLKRRFAECCDGRFCLIEVGADEVTVKEAVESYLFNSQLVTLPDGGMCLIAPVECEDNPRTKKVLDRILYEENPIRSVLFVDVRQSMKNGGGPACLRLRVVLTEEEMGRTHQGVYLTDRLFAELTSWGEQCYRDQLSPADLADPALAEEGRAALDVLTQILKLGSIYRFQKSGA